MLDERQASRCCRGGIFSVCFLLIMAAPAGATSFGDIEVNIVAEPRGNSWHGYFEYVFLVTNRSAESVHSVTLSMPRDKQLMRDDYLRELRRTVRVGAGDTVRVALLQPDYPPVGGTDVNVSIDDRRQEREIPLVPNQRRRGGYSYPYYGGYPSTTHEPLVLVSPSIRKAFPSWGPSGAAGSMKGGPPGVMPPLPAVPPPAPHPPGGPVAAPGMPGMVVPFNAQFIRADPVESWSAHWLAYSRHDGIVVTGDDLESMQPAVRLALWQYVETGGSLLVLGKCDLSGLSVHATQEKEGLRIAEAGFGQCLSSADEDIDQWKPARLMVLAQSWRETGSPWQETRRSSHDANIAFPVVEDLAIPIKGLFVLLLLFTLTIGPVNFLLLAHKKRRIWLLWTTPVISLLTCLAVLGYMLISEGWEGHLRTETLTLLDESNHRATTLGWTAVYSPLTPGDGLHFGYDTEVVPMRMNEGWRAGVRSCTIDWSRDQHFAAGWVEARVPAHFKVRKSETCREHVAIHREADQRLSMFNRLRVEVRRFWYADAEGALYTAEQVAPGASVILTPKNEELPPRERERPRQAFGGTWLPSIQAATQNPRSRLRPHSYLAELDESPFLDDALHSAHTRKCHAVVIGFPRGDRPE